MKKKTAQKLEVLPDYNAPELAIIGSSIAKAVTAIGSKTARYHDEIVYDIVGLGVLYLRAKERVGHGHFGAFLVNSATVADLKISERSAQNYMRAAENAGLTEKSTLKDIEALRARRYDRRIALMLIDVDGFKEVNDRIGHLAGDALLAAA